MPFQNIIKSIRRYYPVSDDSVSQLTDNFTIHNFPAKHLHTMVKMIVCTILLLSVTWGFVYIVRKSGKIGKWIMG